MEIKETSSMEEEKKGETRKIRDINQLYCLY